AHLQRSRCFDAGSGFRHVSGGSSSGSGLVSAALAAGLLLGAQQTASPVRCDEPDKRKVRGLFDKLDVNKDGMITREEWDAGMLNAPKSNEDLIMSADCGGTTTRLMIFAVDPTEQFQSKSLAPGRLLFERKYPNILFKGFNTIVSTFLEDASEAIGQEKPNIKIGVFAVAGVVTKNQCRYTNLDWFVDGEELCGIVGAERIEIINDFVAQGYGVLTLNDGEVDRLNSVEPQEGAPMAVVGAGTGLGSCFLFQGRTGEYKAYPSEGGHVEFAPRGHGSDDVQTSLLKHLKIKLSGWNRVSIERVVSGRGICNVYDFLAYQYPHRVDKLTHEKFMKSPHDASIVSTNAWPGSLCEEALQIFAACYGGYCGNTAITLMPFGGLYLSGGVTNKLKEWMMRDGSFMEAYQDKGRVSPILGNVPLFIVKGEDMGQRGAHLRAVMLLHQIRAGIQAYHLPSGPAELVAPRSLDSDVLSQEIAKTINEYQSGNLRFSKAKNQPPQH
ncbi:unnamed protein product, partial [Polarella glacialis]